ncbi:hypothetical protein OC835_002024 [Tilletia horrida]|nr:hypothetical protein OC835_002024 [Tilletia horrida]
MAKGAAKKAASSNASTLQMLNLGFLLSNAAQLLLRFGLFRASASWKLALLHLSTQAVALFLFGQLRGMAAQGINLAEQKGLTPYMFDVIYVTWFCAVAASLVSDRAWYLYLAVSTSAELHLPVCAYQPHSDPPLSASPSPFYAMQIPGFATFLLYTKLVVPYLFSGRDPIMSLFGRRPGSQGKAGQAPGSAAAAGGAGAAEGQSKRQQKLQKRADRGDPRVRQMQR